MASNGQSFYQKHFLFSNRLVLSIMGLLPNQNSNNQLLILCLIVVYGAPIVINQFYQLVMYDFTLQVTLKIVQIILMEALMVIGYSNTYFSFSRMRLMFNIFKSDCEQLSNEEELNIMKKYTKQVKFYSYVIIFIFSFSYSLIVFPNVINIILYLFGMLDASKLTLILPVNNVSAAGTLYFILFICEILLSLITSIMGSVYYVIYLVFVQHACYQFSVIMWKIRQLSKKKEEYIGTVLNRTIPWEGHEWIVDIIKHYKKVLEYVDLINNYSKIVYLIAVAFAMIIVIADFVYILRISDILQNRKDAIECSLLIITSIIFLYLNFYIGQELLNHSNATGEELRKIPFYMLSVKTQKLLLIIIIRSMKPSNLSIGGMFVASNEVFASIMRKAFSFATVYHSAR